MHGCPGTTCARDALFPSIIVVAVEIVYAEGQRPEAQALRIEGYAPLLERPHPEKRGLGRRPGQVPGDLLEAPDPDHAG